MTYAQDLGRLEVQELLKRRSAVWVAQSPFEQWVVAYFNNEQNRLGRTAYSYHIKA